MESIKIGFDNVRNKKKTIGWLRRLIRTERNSLLNHSGNRDDIAQIGRSTRKTMDQMSIV